MSMVQFDEIEKLTATINGLLNALEGHAPDSDEYKKIADQLVKLLNVKTEIVETHLKVMETGLKVKASDKPDRISKDTLAMIGANLVGIAMIIGYERANIIASKALGFVMRSR